MKKLIALLFLFNLISISSKAQNVGIGTPNPSGKLHLKSEVQENNALDQDYELSTIKAPNNSGDYDWYVTSTDGYNSAKCAKAPLIFNQNQTATLQYPFNMTIDKEVTVSFNIKYGDPSNMVNFEIYSDHFNYTPSAITTWKSYSTTFISQSSSDVIYFDVKANQGEAFPIIHIDNIMITYEDGHVLKIEDGTEAEGHFLKSDALGQTEWYDLTGEIDQKLNDNLQDLEFDTTQNALFIEDGNGVLISSLKNDNGTELKLSGQQIVGSPGMSLFLPSFGPGYPSFHYDAINRTMDWGVGSDTIKGNNSTTWGYFNSASNAFSTSWGFENSSSGLRSTTWGRGNEATESNSTAFGNNNISTADLSTSWGYYNEASGNRSTVFGTDNVASGLESTAWGNNNLSSVELTTSWGENNDVTGRNSTSWGLENVVSSQNSTSWGIENNITGYNNTAWGFNNQTSESYSTAWGLINVSSGSASTAWGQQNEATNWNSTSFGYDNLSSGQLTTTWGRENTASATNTTAWGRGNTASTEGSSVWGYNNSVSSQWATSWGSGNEITNGSQSATACGGGNIASGNYTFVSGLSNEVNSFAEVAFGRYNMSGAGSSSTWNVNNILFSLGNGTSDTDRKNAVTVLKNGNVGIGVVAPIFDLQLIANSAAKPGSNSWIVTSDRRLKKDISEFTDGLDIINAIEPVWFTYNGMADIPEGTFVGTIAQELEKIAPYMVTEFTHRNDDGRSENYKAVDYGAMDFVLINAIKEQQEIIEKQQETIERQQAQIDEIMRLINN